MAWSTSQVADLASTTVNTVRHYHRLGLLEEPERRINGYKQYEVRHLVRLLRIRRLVELGVSLGRIAAVNADSEGRQEVLRELDAALVAGIERRQRARADIALILRENAPADAPAGFESVASRLSESDASILHISAQVYDAPAMADLRQMVEVEVWAAGPGSQIEGLAPDADQATRDRLVQLLAPILVQHLTRYPWLLDPSPHLSRSTRVARAAISEAITELYNPAQLDVLVRASQVARELLQAMETPSGCGPR